MFMGGGIRDTNTYLIKKTLVIKLILFSNSCLDSLLRILFIYNLRLFIRLIIYMN